MNKPNTPLPMFQWFQHIYRRLNNRPEAWAPARQRMAELKHRQTIANPKLVEAAPLMLEELETARIKLELAAALVDEPARDQFTTHANYLGRIIREINGHV